MPFYFIMAKIPLKRVVVDHLLCTLSDNLSMKKSKHTFYSVVKTLEIINK